MSESNNTYVWNANDYSNIITIGASALASVLLVLFKSRCTTISLCFGLLSCNRKPQEEDEEEEQQEQQPPADPNNPPNP